MKDDKFWTAVAAFALGACIGIVVGVKGMCKVAVSEGVARYEVNPKTGDTKFVYIKP